MRGEVVIATARRVVRQLRHDPRTIALVFAMPCILLALMRLLFDGTPAVFQRVGVPLMGIFPLISMFLVTSMALLRERTTGTLERLMTTPLAKAELLLGYGLAFAALATLQAILVFAVGIGLLGLEIEGSLALVLLLTVLNAVLGCTLGLLASAFAETEFQVAQFMPTFILPQLLLCGLFVAQDAMIGVLHAISDLMPMTYAYDGLTRAAASSELSGALLADLAVVAGVALASLLLSAATLRRRTA